MTTLRLDEYILSHRYPLGQVRSALLGCSDLADSDLEVDSEFSAVDQMHASMDFAEGAADEVILTLSQCAPQNNVSRIMIKG